MARNKNFPYKRRLGRAAKQAENVPTWVVMKTKGQIRWTPYSRRHWRTGKLKR